MTTTLFKDQQLVQSVKKALYEGIEPHIAVSVEEIDHERLLVKVVASALNGLSERKKQDMVWNALNALGPDAKSVSLVLAFGTDEI